MIIRHQGLEPISIYDEHLNLDSKLNLGCGRRTLPGFVNLDMIDGDGVNVVHDIEKAPLPFDDNTFDFIFMKSILEHMPHRVDRVRGEFMYDLVNDLIRISKDGARWESQHPCNPLALAATDHPRIIGPATFDPWTSDYSSLEATKLPVGRLKIVSKVNIRRWKADFSFGRTIAYRMVLEVEKFSKAV